MLEQPAHTETSEDNDLFSKPGDSERLKTIATITILHPAFENALAAVEGCLESYRSGGETICVYILGNSGCGKSHLSNLLLRHNPACRREGQLIKPVVRIRVPSDPTIKGFSTAILEKYGDPNASRGNEQEMAGRIDHYVEACGTQLVILEELNHFVDADSEWRNTKVTNWLKIRIEETGVPFLVEGLPYTQVLFDHDEQLRDRFDGPFILMPFVWFERGPEPVLAEIPFCSYLHDLSGEFPFKDCMDFGARRNALRFFCMSDGVPRRIGKLLKQAAMLAEKEHSETIDLDLLRRAYIIRTGHRVTDLDNPFSDAFDLAQAEERLRDAASRPLKMKKKKTRGK